MITIGTRSGIRRTSRLLNAFLVAWSLLAAGPAWAGTPVIRWKNAFSSNIPGASTGPLQSRELADGSWMLLVNDGAGVTAVRFDHEGTELSRASFYPTYRLTSAAIGPFGEVVLEARSEPCFDCSKDTLWLMKYDGYTGRPLWPKPARFGILRLIQDAAFPVLLDPAGNVVAAVLDASGQVWTVRFDGTSGGISWAQPLSIGNTGGLTTDPSGNVIVFMGAVLSGNEHNFQTIAYDGATGNVLWGPMTYDGGGEDYAMVVATDGTRVVVAGTSAVPGGGGQTTLLAYDAVTGALQWGPISYVDPEPGSFTSPLQIAIDGSHDVVVSVGTSGASSSHLALLKYAGASGTLLWGPAPVGAVDRFSLFGNGDILTQGSVQENGFSFVETSRIDGAEGTLVWGPEDESGFGFAVLSNVTSDGRVVLAYSPLNQYPLPTVVSSRAGTNGASIWTARVYGVADSGARARDMALALDGNVVVLAQDIGLQSFDQVTLTKYDVATGATVWGPSALPVYSYVEPLQLIHSPASGFFVLGSFASQTYLFKVQETDGSLMWGPTILPGSATRMAVDPSGNVAVLSGVTGAWIDFSTTRVTGVTGVALWGPASSTRAPDGRLSGRDRRRFPGNVLVAGHSDTSQPGVDRSEVRRHHGGAIWGPVTVVEIANPGMRLAADAAGNVYLAGGHAGIATVKFSGATGSRDVGPEAVSSAPAIFPVLAISPSIRAETWSSRGRSSPISVRATSRQ